MNEGSFITSPPMNNIYHHCMMTSSNGNIFRVTGPFCVDSPHKGQWRWALIFSLIYAWINDWANNRETGDLRRYRGYYDVIVMGLNVWCWKEDNPLSVDFFIPHEHLNFLNTWTDKYQEDTKPFPAVNHFQILNQPSSVYEFVSCC